MLPFVRRNSRLNFFTKKSARRPVPGPVLPNVADDVIGLKSMERGSSSFSAQKMDIYIYNIRYPLNTFCLISIPIVWALPIPTGSQSML